MAYGARLESVLGASPRGFESPILRDVMSRVIVPMVARDFFCCVGRSGSGSPISTLSRVWVADITIGRRCLDELSAMCADIDNLDGMQSRWTSLGEYGVGYAIASQPGSDNTVVCGQIEPNRLATPSLELSVSQQGDQSASWCRPDDH